MNNTYNRTNIIILLIFLILIVPVKAEDEYQFTIDSSSTDIDILNIWNNIKTGDILKIHGIIRRLGNEPFSTLVLTDQEENYWYLDIESIKEFLLPEQEYITVIATVERKLMILANGKIINDKRIIKIIKISE